MASTLSMPAQSSQSVACYSALTLFECTISNAAMLVDSMPLKELVLALKIIGSLQNRVVEVLDPVAVQAADTVQEHQLCPPKVAMVAPVGPVGTSKIEKQEDSMNIKTEMLDDDDDIQILEDCDLSFNDSSTSASFCESSTPSKKQKLSVSAPRDTEYSVGNDLRPEWKAYIRNAYKQLKTETNSNVFDFNLSYSTHVNSAATERILRKTFEMRQFHPANLAHFKKIAHKYFDTYFRSAKNFQRFRGRNSDMKVSKLIALSLKLNRRQKSFESLKSSLPSDETAKIEAVLVKDYTSSDEEGCADLDSDIEVKRLPWESQELTNIKKQLDDYYLENLADAKQKQEMLKLKRTGSCSSVRLPPNDGLLWTKK